MALIRIVLPRRLYSSLRFHWITELLLIRTRRSSTLRLPEVGRELEVQPKDTIIDCGANVGHYVTRFARTGARVIAFEPDPTAFSALSRRFKRIPSITCVNRGVMDRECTLRLRVPAAWDGVDELGATIASSFFADETSGLEVERYVDVDCVDLADFILSNQLHVRLLKLDIEGAEIAVLNRLIATRAVDQIDLIVAETHEELIPKLHKETKALRERVEREGLAEKIDLDWP